MRRLQAFGGLVGLVTGLAICLPAGGCSRRVGESGGKRETLAAEDSSHGSGEQKPVAVETRDPYQQLLDQRERLRLGSTIVLDRTIPELPPRTAAYFHRLRQVSGELAVLRELIRWANDPGHATLLEPARRGELKRWERCWRDWEDELAELTRDNANSER